MLDNSIAADGFRIGDAAKGQQRQGVIDLTKIDFENLAKRFAKSKTKNVELGATQGSRSTRQRRCGNREAGTPEENKAAVQGTIAYFGTYSVSETDNVITFHIEGSTFPNWKNHLERET